MNRDNICAETHVFDPLQSTVHGRCLTGHTVISRQEDATDVTLSRDLSQCDQFYSRTLINSPLALLQQLVRNSTLV